jgi:hypothetical protein
MNALKSGVALAALAAAFAAPVYAQGGASAGPGQDATTGPSAGVDAGLATNSSATSNSDLSNSGSGMSSSSSSSATVLGAGPAVTTTTGAGVTSYSSRWINLPPNVENDPNFQRWKRLK